MDRRIAIFYFLLGILLELPSLSVRLWLINLGIDVPALAIFTSTIVIPWTLKPCYGFISDKFPICGLRRKPYIVLCNFVSTILWCVMAVYIKDIMTAQAVLFTISIMTCFSDVMYDSMLVELAKEEDTGDHGKIQSLCWGARACGALIASAGNGFLLQKIPPQSVFLVEALFPLLSMVLCGCCLRESRKQTTQVTDTVGTGCCTMVKRVCAAMRKPSLWKPGVFVFVFAATPSSYAAFFYFLVNELKFNSVILGVLTCVRHAAMIFGTWLFNKCLRHAKYRPFFVVLVIMSAIIGATPIILVSHMNARIHLPDSATWYMTSSHKPYQGSHLF